MSMPHLGDLSKGSRDLAAQALRSWSELFGARKDDDDRRDDDDDMPRPNAVVTLLPFLPIAKPAFA